MSNTICSWNHTNQKIDEPCSLARQAIPDGVGLRRGEFRALDRGSQHDDESSVEVIQSRSRRRAGKQRRLMLPSKPCRPGKSFPPIRRTTTTCPTPTCRTSSTCGCDAFEDNVPYPLRDARCSQGRGTGGHAYRHGGKAGPRFFLDGMTQAMHRLAEQSHPHSRSRFITHSNSRRLRRTKARPAPAGRPSSTR